MGACNFCNSSKNNHSQFNKEDLTSKQINQYDFKVERLIGKGAFGKVLLVTKRDTGKVYAMKVLNKLAIIKKKQKIHTEAERNILATVKCPFIVQLRYAFQTAEKLYMVLDYCGGGELFYHIKRKGKFIEE